MHGLNIAALSGRTGVAADTLRKWEERYGVLRPTRTEGGQRRYSEVDVERVEWLLARLAEGYRIGEAAALLGSAESEAPATASALKKALYESVARSDAEAVQRLLEQAFALLATETALMRVLRPLLYDVGKGWAAGTLSVAQEHLVSQAIRGRLQHLLSDRRGAVRGEAVLACAPGERHDLGLLMLAVCMRADGWAISYLGPETPVSAALDLARARSASVLGISVTMPEHLKGLSDELGQASVPGGLRVVVGGPATGASLARVLDVVYVRPELPQAVSRLRELVA
ncbi:MAG: MerR family transcriptional regulator [Actinobacteria bacterium]|nr:MerR family transcriptional regulator [Actinomycetota bacterium]